MTAAPITAAEIAMIFGLTEGEVLQAQRRRHELRSQIAQAFDVPIDMLGDVL